MKQRDMIVEMYADVKHIKKTLDGNGGEGLVKKANRHEKKINQLEAIIKFVGFLLGGGVLFAVVAYIRGG